MNGILTIHTQALRKNYRILQKKARKNCEVGAVLKCNAYEAGLEKIAPILWEEGARTFFVATIEEAVKTREIVPEARIVVLGGFWSGHEAAYFEHHLIPVLNSLEEVRRTNDYAHRAAVRLPIFLHLDTGMNRLGVERHHVLSLARDMSTYNALHIECIMSHFSSADESESPLTQEQYKQFQELSEFFPGIPKSLSNSSGLFRSSAYHFDLCRPGMAMYGLNPVPEQENPMQPVISLKASVLQIREAHKGETVGYGASWACKKDGKLATVSAGYGDGILRSLSNSGKLYWKGHALPIRGRVSMDVVSVDLEAIPVEEEHPKPGDMLEIIGSDQSADELAIQAGTIGYEILTSIGSRYKRVYL